MSFDTPVRRRDGLASFWRETKGGDYRMQVEDLPSYNALKEAGFRTVSKGVHCPVMVFLVPVARLDEAQSLAGFVPAYVCV